MPAQLIIRGIPDELNRRLSDNARTAGTTVNALVLNYLEAAVSTVARRRRLNRYMTWTLNDQIEFDAALRAQRRIDPPGTDD